MQTKAAGRWAIFCVQRQSEASDFFAQIPKCALFSVSLVEQILAALCEGAHKFLFWGFNADCLAVLARLGELGFPQSNIVGVVDGHTTGATFQGKPVLTPEQSKGLSVDVLVITVDSTKEAALAEFVKTQSAIPKVMLAGMAHLAFNDPTFEAIIQSCLVKSYATGYPNSQIHLYQAIQYISGRQLKGDVAEFGICKGGTVVFIKKVLKHFGLGDAQVYGFDIFEGFPKSKSVLDLYRHPKCEFRDYDTVVNYCERFDVKVIKGDICETFETLRGKSLILSFFDTDNYSPAKAALPLCAEQTVSGGVIFFDHVTTVEDYINTIGERMAAREVLTPERFFNPHGTGIFIKH